MLKVSDLQFSSTEAAAAAGSNPHVSKKRSAFCLDKSTLQERRWQKSGDQKASALKMCNISHVPFSFETIKLQTLSKVKTLASLLRSLKTARERLQKKCEEKLMKSAKITI